MTYGEAANVEEMCAAAPSEGLVEDAS